MCFAISCSSLSYATSSLWVGIGVANGRCCRDKVDFERSCLPCHLHNFTCSGTVDYGVINKEDVTTGKFRLEGVQLETHGLLTRSLSRHDEGTRNVPILDEPLMEGTAQNVSRLKSRRTT
eukprot:8511289-Ditylum_brightwellii.AAC.1